MCSAHLTLLCVFYIVLQFSGGVQSQLDYGFPAQPGPEHEFAKKVPDMLPLKCKVCSVVMRLISEKIEEEDPSKMIEVSGGFRLLGDGTMVRPKKKPYKGSHTHVEDVLEDICGQMDNFAQAYEKSDGSITLIELAKEMSRMSEVKIVQDPELNSNLKKVCENMVGEYDDQLVRMFAKHKIRAPDQASRLFCQRKHDICPRAQVDQVVGDEDDDIDVARRGEDINLDDDDDDDDYVGGGIRDEL